MRLSSFPLATHPDDAARDMALYRDLAAGKRAAYAIEKRYRRKDGRIVQGSLVVALVRDPFGRPLHTIGMLTDITALKAAEAGLTEAQHQIALLREEAARRDRQLHQQDSGLTNQEWEVMQLVVQGRKNAQIAARLHIAETTVKTHIRHINEKLGTANRREIAALARERGW
jgi:DNA-binding CsgD family transcriptional regulator